MAKTVTFGELMLRLAPEGYDRLFQNGRMEATFGGAEANVAVSLANFGLESRFVTKLPTHEVGQAAVNSLRSFGVDTSQIVRGGERVGIYFLEKGASQRPALCVYDRANSAIQTAQPEEFDWDTILQDADWFHFTGITPALGENLAALCLRACMAAKERGILVSCDLNYRQKLWSQAEARRVMGDLFRYADVCIANEWQAGELFCSQDGKTRERNDENQKERARAVAKQLAARFGFQRVALTCRRSFSADDNEFSGMLYDGREFCFSREYRLHMVDRVGGGDAFAAGLIYALLHDMPARDSIEFATAAGALKHSVNGDYNRVSVREVEALAWGDGAGSIRR